MTIDNDGCDYINILSLSLQSLANIIRIDISVEIKREENKTQPLLFSVMLTLLLSTPTIKQYALYICTQAFEHSRM